MGIDWEEMLGAEGDDLQDAYDDAVWEADAYERKAAEAEKLATRKAEANRGPKSPRRDRLCLTRIG